MLLIYAKGGRVEYMQREKTEEGEGVNIWKRRKE